MALMPIFATFEFMIPQKYLRLIFLLKLSRLVDGFEQLSHSNFIRLAKMYFN